MFCRLSRKNFACYFLVQSRPNTIANKQPSSETQGFNGRPLRRFVCFDKICPCPTSRSHLFLRLFDKMYRACNADQSQDNCFFVFLNCLTSSRSQKTYSHLFSVTSDTLMMKSTNCYKICPLVRIGPKCTLFLASFADVPLARHAIFSPQRWGGMRDEPKERLRRRLPCFHMCDKTCKFAFSCHCISLVFTFSTYSSSTLLPILPFGLVACTFVLVSDNLSRNSRAVYSFVLL